MSSFPPLPRLVLLSALLLAVGCGVGDYETRMSSAQARLQRWEEESANLGQPLAIPTREDKNKVQMPLADLFFRPPKGFDPNPAKEPRNGLLYAYRPPAPAVTPGVAAPPPPPAMGKFAYLELAFGQANQKDFASDVVRCYGATDQVKHHRRQVRGPGQPQTVTFDTTTFEDAANDYLLCVWRGQKTQIAIVFALVKGQRSAAERTIGFCLESFAAEGDAPRARNAYNAGSPLRPPPKGK